MQCILYKIYFLKGFSYVLQIDMHFICTPMWTNFYSCKKWVLQGAWSSETLQACLEAEVVALADALELAACWPWFVAWSATSVLPLSKLTQVLVVEVG
jgi:hypothetical protein